MLKRYLMIALVIFLLILATISSTLAIVFYINSNSLRAEITRLETEVANLKTAQVSPTPTPSVMPKPDCFNQSADGWIRITDPCKDEKVSSPILIKGRSKGIFKAELTVQILDKDNKEVLKKNITMNGEEIATAAELTDFYAMFDFDVPPSLSEGTIRIFAISAKDGTEMHEVKIDVKF